MKKIVKILKDRVSIDDKKVVLPSQLELALERDDNCDPKFIITLCGAVIDQFIDEDNARKRYIAMKEAIRNGEYQLIFNSSLKPSIYY